MFTNCSHGFTCFMHRSVVNKVHNNNDKLVQQINKSISDYSHRLSIVSFLDVTEMSEPFYTSNPFKENFSCESIFLAIQITESKTSDAGFLQYAAIKLQ